VQFDSPLIYLLPFFAALIGWFTNYLAIKMLFHPRKPVNLILFKVQGIFPKRQQVLAERLGKMVANDLVHASDIKNQLADPETSKEIHRVIEKKLEDFLQKGLKEQFPMLAMFLNEDTLQKIKGVFTSELEKALPEIIDTFLGRMEQNLNIEKMVTDKVSNFQSNQLEELLFSILKKEFKFIEVVGAILGFLIGTLQLGLLYLQ